MGINRVEITGNLTRDCEVKTLPSGAVAIEFGVAVNERRKNRDGEWEDYPNFVDCTVFAKSDKHERWLSHELVKGTKVSIDGRLRYSSWEKDGQKRSKLGVIVTEIEFMTAHKDGASGSERPAQAPRERQEKLPANTRKTPPVVPPMPSADEYDEDIPF